jgi:endonuclease YncB( thermonuclease family)
LLFLLLTACGPQIGDLEKGETGRVVRVSNGDTLELDSGLRVFLAEIDAPRGEAEYAGQSQGELEALALHRPVQLAYGGQRRWTPRPRPGDTETPRETAIAHVFVQSEGGRWFWLQHELVSRGAAFVRPRRDNHERAEELIALEDRARDGEQGLWGRRDYRTATTASASEQALAANVSCFAGAAPWRVIEASVSDAYSGSTRAALTLEGGDEATPFTIVVFGASFEAWDGPALASLNGARIRARGPLGVFRGQPQLCLDHSSQLDVLTAE